MIHLPSSDPDGVIGQFYSAAAASTKGMSVLSVDNIIRGAPRVLVMTLTMWTKDPKGRLKPSKTRTDSVFGLNPTAVCFVVCNCKDGCDDELTFLVCQHTGTDNVGCYYVSDSDPQHHPSDPEGPPPLSSARRHLHRRGFL